MPKTKPLPVAERIVCPLCRQIRWDCPSSMACDCMTCRVVPKWRYNRDIVEGGHVPRLVPHEHDGEQELHTIQGKSGLGVFCIVGRARPGTRVGADEMVAAVRWGKTGYAFRIVKRCEVTGDE